MVYKWCIVPLCTNTSIKTPQKLFVSVPTNPKRRNKWLQLARRDPNSILSHTNVFMCEDHFDMEKDTINYMKYKMGFCSKILLTDEAVPSKFHCQEDIKRRLGDPDHQSAVIAKRKRMELLKQFEEGSHVQSQDMTETVQKDDNIVQEAMESDEAIDSKRKKILETEIKEENIQVDDNTDQIIADEFVADSDIERTNESADTTDPIKTEELHEFELTCCLNDSQKETNRRRLLHTDSDTDDTEQQNNTEQRNTEDPDLSFFYSVLPDMKEMSGEQKRRFKIGVLQLAGEILQEK